VELIKLNLGCADNILPGYINIDHKVFPGFENVVVQMDLNQGLSYPGDSADVILASDVLEHLTNQINIMNECWRVLKMGGIFDILIPTTDGRGAFQDPDHKSFWNRNTFWYYDKSNAHHSRFAKHYGIKAAFSVIQEQEQHLDDKIEKLWITLRKETLPW
jgi:predicted SAM-dependent methyltransferase